jgi:hypothetical protein
MKRFTPSQWDLARQWLYAHGRPLDQRWYEHLFEGAPTAPVVIALAAFQNPDGGFGNGLEPDVRTPASSVIATTTALGLLRHLGIGSDEPLAQRAVGYLVAAYEPAAQRWPMVPPAVENAPHAPWWTYASIETAFRGFALNPTADVVGLLHDFTDRASAPPRQAALEAVLARLATTPDPLSKDEMLCLLALAEARGLDEAARRQIGERIRKAVPTAVVQDPAAWGSYCLTPLEVAPTPAARFAALLDRQAIDAQLDQWIDTQAPDGSWGLVWSWADVDAAAWAQAEADWKGRHIVERLTTLSAYGRAVTIEP